jgi:hypothetical protein
LKNIWWHKNLLIMQFSPPSCCLLPLSTTYFPQHHSGTLPRMWQIKFQTQIKQQAEL